MNIKGAPRSGSLGVGRPKAAGPMTAPGAYAREAGTGKSFGEILWFYQTFQSLRRRSAELPSTKKASFGFSAATDAGLTVGRCLVPGSLKNASRTRARPGKWRSNPCRYLGSRWPQGNPVEPGNLNGRIGFTAGGSNITSNGCTGLFRPLVA